MGKSRYKNRERDELLMTMLMRAVSLNHHHHHRRRHPKAARRRGRAKKKKRLKDDDVNDDDDKCGDRIGLRRDAGTISDGSIQKEEVVTTLKVFLATRPLDGFERVHEILGGGKLYPKQLLHHATVVEMTTERSRWMTSAGSEPSEGTKEETSLHYLVDFAPKNALAVDTAFKLLVLRTSVQGVIRHEIVEKTFTNRYALSGIEQIGEVKRKSILEAAFDAANASAADAEASKTRGAYEAIDRVSEEEFYAFYDWQNLKLCENDCRDFARAYLEYLLDDSR